MATLFFGDNLNILRESIKDESVDLIYLDPPFNSKRDYNLLFKSSAEWWACALVNAQPFQGKKKGADTGIDGLIFFQDEANAFKKIIVSVKGGDHVGVSMAYAPT